MKKPVMRKFISYIAACAFLSSCASTHPGQMGKLESTSKNLDLKISIELNKDFSDNTNMFYDLTFENASGHWAHIDQMSVEFVNAGDTVHNVVVGDDLKAWAESYVIRKKKEDHDADMGIAGMIIGGTLLMVAAVAGAKGGNISGPALTAGALAYTGGVVAGTAREISQLQKAANRGLTVPESHLLAPGTIPSNGFLQKWFLVNVPQKRIANILRLKVHTVEGDEGIFALPLTNRPVL